MDWYDTRVGLLHRFCEIDTADWDEGDFFHFLEKPWQTGLQQPKNYLKYRPADTAFTDPRGSMGEEIVGT